MIARVFFFLLWAFWRVGEGLAAEPLDPEAAFRFSARWLDGQTLEARWQVADGYYLYKEKIAFSATPDSIVLGPPELPKGKEKEDEFFGRVEILRGEVVARVPLRAGSPPFTLKATSQGCWDGGVCYPPLTQEVRLEAADVVTAMRPATAPLSPFEGAGDESGRIARLLAGAGFWWVVVTFLGFGLLLALTPCVFPMIPILSGIIVQHGHAVTHARAFALSLAYVLGMAVTYAAVGVFAGLSGTLLSNALQNAWVLGAFALVFVLLALSMFGFYELQLPSAWQSKLSESANRRGGSFAAIAAMGALSALIVGPCVAAPLAGALLYIATTRDAWLGGAALFAMGLGMGAPLLVIGALSRTLLPRPGPWMEGVKKFFGVLMLAVALWLVSPVLPSWLVMLGWALLAIVPAIYLSALDPLPAHASGWQRLWKGVGIGLLLYGAALLIGLLSGSRDPLQPLGVLRAASAQAVQAPPLAFQPVKSLIELEAVLSRTNKPVLLDFYADWCVSCKEMEKFTFSDARVAAKMKEFVLLKADVTGNSAEDRAMLRRFGLFGPPAILFFAPGGEEMADLRVIGFESAERFLATLARALGET
ncbi:MAG: protein-disulfide reductase DsbD [Rhodocyclaceae bacterium]|nr:protein-disulfide reductase DsbD [Rhodocyclaceae bacterium]